MTLSSCNAMDSPMVMPPRNCDRAVFAFITRPTAKTPSSRATVTSPVSASTWTSENCAP